MHPGPYPDTDPPMDPAANPQEAPGAADDNLEQGLAEHEEDAGFRSKSAKKREAERLRKMGQDLTKLSAEQLKKLELDDRLLTALLDYQRFPSHGAKRRQLQLIGGILRKIDVSAVEEKLAVLNGEAASARYQLHQLEQWRDRLLADRAALTDYLHEHKATDRQQLRQLVQKAQRATSMGSALETPQAKAAARALFRFLRDNG